MGLFITGYAQAVRINDPDFEITDEDERENGEACDVHVVRGFEARLRDLPPGHYRVAGRKRFCNMGPYSAYSSWREYLAQVIHDEPIAEVWARASALEASAREGHDMPAFYELIHFPDNTGCIGPSVCKKLHADFVQHDTHFRKWVESQVGVGHIGRYDAEWLIECYVDLRDAFAVAAQGGLVKFH